MKLLVSIHDVAPPFEAEVDRLWHICRSNGVTPALLVVPEWHGRWPLERHSRFVSWLHGRVGEGAELMLHGERHDEIGSQRALADDLRAFGRTDGEGEFLTLEREAALDRIERGLRRLRALDLEPVGFVPPAWLARRAGHAAVAAAGLAVSEDERAIYLHRRAMHVQSPVLRWSGRSALRAWASVRVVRLASWWHRNHWVVRIALHPRDLHADATSRAVEPTLRRWLAVRRPFTYGAL